MIYIASPYSNNPEYNYKRNKEITLALMLLYSNEVFYNPICYGHQFREQIGDNYEAWFIHNIAYMKVCKEMVVLTLKGWEQSEGVKSEIEYFKRNNKKIYFLEVK